MMHVNYLGNICFIGKSFVRKTGLYVGKKGRISAIKETLNCCSLTYLPKEGDIRHHHEALIMIIIIILLTLFKYIMII